MFSTFYPYAKISRVLFSLLIALGVASRVHAATASWDRNTEPNVAGYLVSYGTQPGDHSSTIDVGNVTTFQFNPEPGRRYYIVVRAYTTDGFLSEKSSEAAIEILAPRPAPTPVRPPTPVPPLPPAPRPTPVPPPAPAPVPAPVLNRAPNSTQPAATVIDLSPIDTTLMVGGGSYSAATWLKAHTWPANKVAAAILMKFNLSQIPANATIQSAVLNLSLTGVDYRATDPNYLMSLHQIVNRNPDVVRATGRMADGSKPWTASNCCAHNMPMAQADLSRPHTATVVNRTLGYKSWDAASMVRAWVAYPSSNFGLLLNADVSKGSDSHRTFASMQDEKPSRRPFLRVTYTVPASNSASASNK